MGCEGNINYFSEDAKMKTCSSRNRDAVVRGWGRCR